MICKIIGGYMLAKTLVVFYVWSPDIFVLIVIITLFQALFILLCQIKHYHTIKPPPPPPDRIGLNGLQLLCCFCSLVLPSIIERLESISDSSKDRS